MKHVNNVADLIGATPLVKLNRIQNNSGADVYVKLESANPSRSVKDRAAFNMIVEAEKANYLKPGSTIIDRKSTRLNSSHVAISYAVFCLKKKILYDMIDE